MSTPEYFCVITQKPITTFGSRKKVIEGQADGVSTNIGLVSKEGLAQYDEAVRNLRGSAAKRCAGIIEQIQGVPSAHFQKILFDSGFSEIEPGEKSDYFRRKQRAA